MRTRWRMGIMRVLFFLAVASSSLDTASAKTSVVSFNTTDGWKITGNLTLPDKPPGGSMAAVVMLTEPGWVDRSIYETYLSDDLAKAGIAALAIDLRGSGNSLSPAKKVLEEFSS